MSKQILVGLTLTTLAIMPQWTLDPFNLPKMFFLVVTAFAITGTLFNLRKAVNWRIYKTALSVVLSFNIWVVFVLFLSGSGIAQQIYGASGRNIGVVTLFALSIFFIGSVLASSDVLIKNISITALFVGAISIIYELLQMSGSDPIDWVKLSKGSFGFQGNSNFQSSLIGMIGVIALVKLFVERRLKYRALYVLYFLFTILGLIGCESKQGFLVILFGSGIALMVLLVRFNRTLGIVLGSFMGLSLLATLFGLLNIGPLAPLLYGDSIAIRGDFWRAGWRITNSNPVFGVGIDSFEKSYLLNRDLSSVTREPRSEIGDSAHNIFIDLSSTGGLPLAVIYCSLVMLVFTSAIKVILRSKALNSNFLGLVGAWFGFQAQSLISVNHIGLAIWGWVLSGLIIGYELNPQDSKVTDKSNLKNSLLIKNSQDDPKLVIIKLISVTAGFLVALPPLIASAKYKSALESTNVTKIVESIYLWPQQPLRMAQTAIILNSDNFKSEALMIAKDAVSIFPDEYSCWAALYEMDGATVEEKARALLQMKRLDPLGARNL